MESDGFLLNESKRSKYMSFNLVIQKFPPGVVQSYYLFKFSYLCSLISPMVHNIFSLVKLKILATDIAGYIT